MSRELSLEEFKEAWKELEVREAKEGFIAHLIAYIVVNAFIAFINLWASPREIWFVWPLAAWGIGLVFHYAYSRPRYVVDSVEKKTAVIESLAKKLREQK
ncbi:MAG: 2TM domain-containing protein [Candidatus Caldarchaeales archaeon]